MLPSYLKLSKKEILERVEKAYKLLSPCRVCPRKCKADRLTEKKLGFCKAGRCALITAFHPHFGEEKVLVGNYGSGTIFFTSCNMACVYCQNYEISQLRIGKKVEAFDLAKMMISLQGQGCANINLVSPTIWVPQILEALVIAIPLGLRIPLVYNTGGYDRVETLKLLQGIVDIYMPDIKYSDNKIGLKYSLTPNYWNVVKKAVTEMYSQVGDLLISEQGLAVRGLLVRHLVLPEGLAGTDKAMKFIASVSKNTFVNLMNQYYPENKAFEYAKINRRVRQDEYQDALRETSKTRLHRLES